MTYRQLQQALKQLRNEGVIPAGFKLNQKKEVLQSVWDEMNTESVDDSFYKFISQRHEELQARMNDWSQAFTELDYKMFMGAKHILVAICECRIYDDAFDTLKYGRVCNEKLLAEVAMQEPKNYWDAAEFLNRKFNG